MRTITTKQDKLLTGGKFKVVYSLLVEDPDNNLVDITNHLGVDWVQSISYGENIDDPVMSLDADLFAESYGLSMMPLMESSKVNRDSMDNYVAFLDTERDIVLKVAIVAQNETAQAGDFMEVFRGKIDEVNPAGAQTENKIQIRARGQGGFLQDTMIETVERYGSDSSTEADVDYMVGPLEDLLQDLLDNWVSGTTLYSINGTGATPFNPADSPSFSVTLWDVGIQSVMDALRLAANQIGWECRYRWQKNKGAFELHLFEPDRTATSALRTFGPEHYFDVTALETSSARVRNAIEVTYQTDPKDEKTRTSVTVTDPTSIGRYGRRWMRIDEAATSAIDTGAEATKMATAILNDLKSQDNNQTIDMLYFPHAELGDLYQFDPNGRHYTTAQKRAVGAVRHELKPGTTRTYLETTILPSGGVDIWWKKAQLPGIGTASRDKTPNPAVGVTLTSNIDGLWVSWTNQLDKRTSHYEVHTSQTSGFTPSGSTLVGTTRGQHYRIPATPSGDPWFVKVISVDYWGNKAVASSQVSAKAGFYPGPTVSTLDNNLVAGQHVLLSTTDRMYRRMTKTYDDLILDIGPEGYWKFDETSGTTATDESPEGNDLTYQNTPTLGADPIIPDGGKSVNCPNSNEGMYSGLSTSGTNIAKLSFECWLEASNTGGVEQWLLDGKTTLLAQSFSIRKASSQLLEFHCAGSNFTPLIKGAILFNGNPTHVACIWEASTAKLRLYINSKKRVEIDNVNSGGTITIDKLAIGCESDGGGTPTITHSCLGKVDNAAIYFGLALTEAQITEHYLRGIQDLHVDFERVPSL